MKSKGKKRLSVWKFKVIASYKIWMAMVWTCKVLRDIKMSKERENVKILCNILCSSVCWIISHIKKRHVEIHMCFCRRIWKKKKDHPVQGH